MDILEIAREHNYGKRKIIEAIKRIEIKSYLLTAQSERLKQLLNQYEHFLHHYSGPRWPLQEPLSNVSLISCDSPYEARYYSRDTDFDPYPSSYVPLDEYLEVPDIPYSLDNYRNLERINKKIFYPHISNNFYNPQRSDKFYKENFNPFEYNVGTVKSNYCLVRNPYGKTKFEIDDSIIKQNIPSVKQINFQDYRQPEAQFITKHSCDYPSPRHHYPSLKMRSPQVQTSKRFIPCENFEKRRELRPPLYQDNKRLTHLLNSHSMRLPARRETNYRRTDYADFDLTKSKFADKSPYAKKLGLKTKHYVSFEDEDKYFSDHGDNSDKRLTDYEYDYMRNKSRASSPQHYRKSYRNSDDFEPSPILTDRFNYDPYLQRDQDMSKYRSKISGDLDYHPKYNYLEEKNYYSKNAVSPEGMSNVKLDEIEYLPKSHKKLHFDDFYEPEKGKFDESSKSNHLDEDSKEDNFKYNYENRTRPQGKDGMASTDELSNDPSQGTTLTNENSRSGLAEELEPTEFKSSVTEVEEPENSEQALSGSPDTIAVNELPTKDVSEELKDAQNLKGQSLKETLEMEAACLKEDEQEALNEDNQDFDKNYEQTSNNVEPETQPNEATQESGEANWTPDVAEQGWIQEGNGENEELIQPDQTSFHYEEGSQWLPDQYNVENPEAYQGWAGDANQSNIVYDAEGNPYCTNEAGELVYMEGYPQGQEYPQGYGEMEEGSQIPQYEQYATDPYYSGIEQTPEQENPSHYFEQNLTYAEENSENYPKQNYEAVQESEEIPRPEDLELEIAEKELQNRIINGTLHETTAEEILETIDTEENSKPEEVSEIQEGFIEDRIVVEEEIPRETEAVEEEEEKPADSPNEEPAVSEVLELAEDPTPNQEPPQQVVSDEKPEPKPEKVSEPPPPPTVQPETHPKVTKPEKPEPSSKPEPTARERTRMNMRDLARKSKIESQRSLTRGKSTAKGAH